MIVKKFTNENRHESTDTEFNGLLLSNQSSPNFQLKILLLFSKNFSCNLQLHTENYHILFNIIFCHPVKRETSMEQLSPDSKGIKDKLRNFIKRRPMKETLEHKGIYKGKLCRGRSEQSCLSLLLFAYPCVLSLVSYLMLMLVQHHV